MNGANNEKDQLSVQKRMQLFVVELTKRTVGYHEHSPTS